MARVYNPFLPSWEYVPDGEPYIFGDKLYLFGSHDCFGGDKFCMNDYVCWSAPVDDLSEWRNEGVIYRKEQDPRNINGSHRLYAPDVQQGLDDRFYLYYALDDTGIMSVAVCDTPAGKYSYYGSVQYPNGEIIGEKEGDIHQFDPGIFIDDDERIYLYSGFAVGDGAESYFGGRKVNGMYCMELERDMITVKSGPSLVLRENMMDGKKRHGFFEANSMRKIEGTYYLIYSSSWCSSDSPRKSISTSRLLIRISSPLVVFISIGLMCCGDVGDNLMTCPPKRFTNGKYSASGSDMIMSSSVIRKTLIISRFALNDLPEPGVPKKSPLGLCCQGLFLQWKTNLPFIDIFGFTHCDFSRSAKNI